jgi:hypothetical protein
MVLFYLQSDFYNIANFPIYLAATDIKKNSYCRMDLRKKILLPNPSKYFLSLGTFSPFDFAG